MTAEQRRACSALLAQLCPSEVHHGDAIGADAEFHTIARNAGIRIVVHPPLEARDRAFCAGDDTREPDRYKVRNRALVDTADIVIGAPAATEAASPHSGTWYTLRYARRQGKRVEVIWPTGMSEALE